MEGLIFLFGVVIFIAIWIAHARGDKEAAELRRTEAYRNKKAQMLAEKDFRQKW